MIDWTKPVQTRDGRKVRVLCTDMKQRTSPVAGLITSSDGEEYQQSWGADGLLAPRCKGAADLINVPEKRVVWVNMCKDGVSGCFTSRGLANLGAYSSREACVRIEYEVGQYDEEPEV